MEHRAWIWVLLFILHKHSTSADTPFAPNVYCGVQDSVLVETDPNQHRYLPFMTKLKQCGGSAGLHKPSIKKCIMKTSQNVSYKVRNLPSMQVEVITLQQHTSCQSACVLSEKSCDLRYQKWNSYDCQCKCKYKSEPKVSPCSSAHIWKQSTCSCACPTLPQKCPPKKEWDKDQCKCTCTKRYMNRCTRKNMLLRQEDCSCVEPLPGSTAASNAGKKCSGIAASTFAVALVVEFLVLVIMFFFIYRCCLFFDPKLEPVADRSIYKQRMENTCRKWKEIALRNKKKRHSEEALKSNHGNLDINSHTVDGPTNGADTLNDMKVNDSGRYDEPYAFHRDNSQNTSNYYYTDSVGSDIEMDDKSSGQVTIV
eukprot:gene8872-9821_t